MYTIFFTVGDVLSRCNCGGDVAVMMRGEIAVVSLSGDVCIKTGLHPPSPSPPVEGGRASPITPMLKTPRGSLLNSPF